MLLLAFSFHSCHWFESRTAWDVMVQLQNRKNQKYKHKRIC